MKLYTAKGILIEKPNKNSLVDEIKFKTDKALEEISKRMDKAMYDGPPPYVPVALTDKYGDVVEETKDPTPAEQMQGLASWITKPKNFGVKK
jgi:hypothetical protein